jgi:Domain of unknown function (DUF5666)
MQPVRGHAGRMDEGSDFSSDEFAGFPEPPPPARGPRRRVPPLTLAAIAVAGATIGVAAVMIADIGTGTTAAVGGAPSAQAPSGVGNTGGAYPGGGPSGLSPVTGSGSGLRMMLSGRVTAVSATSITIGGIGPSVTAKVTQATQFSGEVHSIGGVKVGDRVSATLSGSSASSLTATAIEDPAAAQ